MKKFAVSVALIGLCTSTQAQAKERPFAEVAETVILALAKGDDLSELDLVFKRYKHDTERAARLVGCRPQLLTGSMQGRLWVDWTCPDTNNNIFTQIYFSGNKVSALAYQPMKQAMVATPVALAAGDLGSPEDINDRFVGAVLEGQDPTLGGLIPITEDQLADLAGMAPWAADDASFADGSVLQRWARYKRREGDAAMTYLHFDSAGHPIGLWLFKTQIVAVTTTEIR